MGNFCSNCGKELSDGVDFCSNCGQKINDNAQQTTGVNAGDNKAKDKKPKKKRGCLTAILSLMIIGFGGIAVMSMQNSLVQKNISGVSDDSEYITMEEYNSIQAGMSYDEVKEIVSSEGEVSAESSVAGYSTKIITWYGNGVAGSNANVTFLNDVVQSKAQAGLQ